MIGVVGLGNMGRAIAERLEEVGETLTVWNRSVGKAKGLAANCVGTPGAVARVSEIVVSVLANDAATEAVYFGPDGFASEDLTGRVIVELCTMSPGRARALDAAITGAGGLFLECPVGGTIAPARAGKLLGLAGGSKTAFEVAKPVLDHLTRRLEHLGPVGQGAAMKLSINLPLMVYWSALGEALGLAVREGIDPSLALDILADSSGAIGAAKTRVPPISNMVVSGNSGGVNFALDTALKDMGEMVALAESQGGPHGVIDAARARSAAAQADGFGELDTSLVAAYGFRKD